MDQIELGNTWLSGYCPTVRRARRSWKFPMVYVFSIAPRACQGAPGNFNGEQEQDCAAVLSAYNEPRRVSADTGATIHPGVTGFKRQRNKVKWSMPYLSTFYAGYTTLLLAVYDFRKIKKFYRPNNRRHGPYRQAIFAAVISDQNPVVDCALSSAENLAGQGSLAGHRHKIKAGGAPRRNVISAPGNGGWLSRRPARR